MKILSVRLDDAEAAQLRALCELTGLTPSQLVKRSIAELACTGLCARRPAQLAHSLGLIGSFGGLRDLAAKSRLYLRKRSM